MALAAQEELWDPASSDTPILSWTLDWAEARELGYRIPLESFWKLQVKNTPLLLLGMRTWPQKEPRREGSPLFPEAVLANAGHVLACLEIQHCS